MNERDAQNSQYMYLQPLLSNIAIKSIKRILIITAIKIESLIVRESKNNTYFIRWQQNVASPFYNLTMFAPTRWELDF